MAHIFSIAAILFCAILCIAHCDSYKVGVGRADCTGPSAEIVFMGYAKSNQKGCGLHLRQFSRAYIFEDENNNRVAFVTVDACMMAHGIRKEVIRRLNEKYPDVYSFENLAISGTHTHGAPGGFLQDLMFDIPNFGFVKDTYEALISGITRSIENAHNNMVDAKIFINTGEVRDANINRSPYSYENNPSEDTEKYETNTDKTLVQLKIVREDDNVPIGAINWYAVHPTSMNNTNCLVTSDNVGYASVLLESSINIGKLPGKGDFVGAFASSNLGDVSPNTKGPKCINTGEDCDYQTSTCDGENKYCIAFGPGDNMFESTEIIATHLFNGATDLFNADNATEVTGDVGFIHQFVDMPSQKVETEIDGQTVTVSGCFPAMGYGFAAGTTDGPGEFDFKQGTQTDNPFWNAIRDFLSPPTPEDIACQYPKPILLNTGRINIPYEWQPHIVTNQILKIGNFIIVAVPGEFTTMSGRRMRDAVKNTIIQNGGPDNTQVVIAGLSNVYTNYIATPEEYQIQRYEGASTIFGPHTLTIYLKSYTNLAENLIKGNSVEQGPTPPDFSDSLLSLVTPVLFDSSGFSNNFGDCVLQPDASYNVGDTVKVTFISGHPRNDPRQESTFLTVEKQNESDNSWEVVATDASWETRFIWRRTNFLKGMSQVDILWTIKQGTEPGKYRINHYGKWKYIFGGMFDYQGTSKTFTVVDNSI